MASLTIARRAMLLSVLLLAGCSNGSRHWQLTDISGHLPNLEFALTSDQGRAVTARDYHGDVVMLYFGYTHCPDVCPATLARLSAVMQHLGNKADKVKILFVSVDPARDTPAMLHTYDAAFGPHVIGLTGSENAIIDVARRYRVAYQAGKPDADGNYDVTHSSGVYIFDENGRARLLATNASSIGEITYDVNQLL
ncbi:MAG: SCO family protein [Burkholderiaceae bacterium]|nr:MAG: SCO family protein [Burkholderiaceae bacterium]